MSDEKTEEATPHKLSEARKKGQVAKSNDLAGTAVLVASYLFFSMMGISIITSLASWVKAQMLELGTRDLTMTGFGGHLLRALYTPMILLAQVFAVVAVAGVIGHLLQTGWMTSVESLRPKMESLNPVEGFKKVFSQRSFLETLKVILRTLMMILVFRSFLAQNMPRILIVSRLDMAGITKVYGEMVMSLFYNLLLLMVVTSVLDYFFQLYMFNKQMMMTQQEIKEEHKSMDGDPFVKSRIRSKQKQMAKARMLQDVKTAKVVITNPTHFAVALRFDEKKDLAPVVVAKGQDHLAAQIRKLAAQHKVRLHENKPLARALYDLVDVGQEIPEDMYQVVAEIIAFIERVEMGLERGE